MKRSIFIALHFFSVAATAQLAQISSTRLDGLRLGMPLDSVNTLAGTKIKLNATQDPVATDSLWIQYKSDSVRLIFYRSHDQQMKPQVQGIYAASTSLKTRSGIAIGDDKFEVLKKLDGSTLRLAPDWRKEKQPERKSYSTVVLYDYSNDSLLTFFFKDNRLYAMECSGSAGDY